MRSSSERRRLERKELVHRYETARLRSLECAEAAAEASREAERYARAIRELGELLGLEEQLSLTALSDDLRGERLREVAAEVLWRNFHEGDVVHYKKWYDLVVSEGHRVGGEDPLWATFLTQIANVATVERVGRRSGLYKLKAA